MAARRRRLAPSSPGLLRYLGWTAAARHLRPVVAAFSSWRDEERWLRSYCPCAERRPRWRSSSGRTRAGGGSSRCGRCGARWQFSRTVCPFCEADAQKTAALTIEGEGGLRIDYCESCQAYLKTYDGEGNEAVLLADWSSLHLDVLARDRGWKRAAASLYELPAEASIA